MPQAGPARLTRADAVVGLAFLAAGVLALVWLPAFAVWLRLLAAAGVGAIAALGVGLVVYRNLRDDESTGTGPPRL